jgi:hypothetical protein
MPDKLPENTNPNSVEKKSLPSEKTSGVSYQNIVDIFSKSLFSLKLPKSSKDEKEDLSKKSNEESINLIELLKQNKVFANLDQISKSLNETTKLLKYNNDLVAKEADDAKEISSSEDESFTEQEAEDERQHKELIDAIKNIKGGGGKEKQKDSNSSFPPILGTLSKILGAVLILNGIYQAITHPKEFAGMMLGRSLAKQAASQTKKIPTAKPTSAKPTTSTPKPTPEVVGKPDLTKAADPKPDKLNQPGQGGGEKTLNEAGEIVDNKAVQKVEQKTTEAVEKKTASGSIKQLAKKAVDPKVLKSVLTPKNIANVLKTAGVGVVVELGTEYALKQGLGMTGGESAKTDGANAGEVIQSGPRKGMVAQQKNGALDNAAELLATAAGGAATGAMVAGPAGAAVGAAGSVIMSEVMKPKIVDMVAQSVGIDPEVFGGGTENRGTLYNVEQLLTSTTATGAGELVSGIGQMTGLGELTGLQESEESKNKKSVKEYSDQAKNWAAKNTPEFIKSITDDALNTKNMEEAGYNNQDDAVRDISAKLKDYVKEGIISQKQADSVSKNFSESSQKKIKEAAIPKLSEVAVGASAVGSAEKKPDLVASTGNDVGFKEIYGILQVIAAKTGSGGGGSGVTNSTEIASETVGSTVNNEAIFRESDSQDTSRST